MLRRPQVISRSPAARRRNLPSCITWRLRRMFQAPHQFQSGNRPLALSKAQRFEWKGPDNFQEDGIVVYPPNFQKGRKYPLVLLFMAVLRLLPRRSSVCFRSSWPRMATLCFHRIIAAAVISATPISAIWNDAGDGPGRDVMAGLMRSRSWGSLTKTRSEDGLVLRRIHDLPAHRPLPNLEGGHGWRACDRPLRRIQSFGL